MPPLVLASKSPRRRELLLKLGFKFEATTPKVEEKMLEEETPEHFAKRLAVAKAASVPGLKPGSIVLGADTVVVVDKEVLGQPLDNDDARRMLRLLSGREHTVITGVAVHRFGGGYDEDLAVTSKVRMRELGEPEIEWYLLTGEPQGKAGAYAVQGAGGALVVEIHGSYSNVVGLPLHQTLDLLKRAGVPPPWDNPQMKWP
jgi:septum formation protein